MIMDKPVQLDEHRGMAAQKSTEVRRRSHEVEVDQAALRSRQEEYERHAVAAPSITWLETAEKAQYLLQLFAATPEGRDPRRQELIARVLDDFATLSNKAEPYDQPAC
jgi:translation initiation factor IF-3